MLRRRGARSNTSRNGETLETPSGGSSLPSIGCGATSCSSWLGTGAAATPIRFSSARRSRRAAAPPGAYIYKLTESGVIHTPPSSQEFGGIARAGSQQWETAGRWSGPDGQGAGAHHGTRTALSDVTYTYCAVWSCSPTAAVDTGNAAVFGLRMLGANRGDTPTVGLIDDATVYEADKGPVVLGAPRHHGYMPGRWVSTAVDTVTGDAAESRGLGIASLRLLGTGENSVPSASPSCSGIGLATCPHAYSGSLSYSTANMPEGTNTAWEQAVSAGGTFSGVRSWSVNIDRKQPTIALSGGLATENDTTISPGTYALRIGARDTDGSTPTSGVAQITVRVDGALQSGVSDFTPCSLGSQCGSVASASWTLDTAHYPAGTHRVTVQATDSAGNAGSANITVTIAPRAEKMYWGADIGKQFTGSTPPFDMNAAKAFANEDAGGKMPSILRWGESFYSPSYCVSTAPYPDSHDCPFQTNLFNAVRQQGFIPMLSWGSSDDSNYSDPNFTDAAVAKGSEDAYITRFAKDAKAWGHPFFLRFDWEMNGPWWSFGTGRRAANQAPPNQPADFVAMWRHVHDIFTRVGATNVTVGLVSELRIQHTGGAAGQCLPGRWVRRLDVYRRLQRGQSLDEFPGSVRQDLSRCGGHRRPDQANDHRRDGKHRERRVQAPVDHRHVQGARGQLSQHPRVGLVRDGCSRARRQDGLGCRGTQREQSGHGRDRRVHSWCWRLLLHNQHLLTVEQRPDTSTHLATTDLTVPTWMRTSAPWGMRASGARHCWPRRWRRPVASDRAHRAC